MCGNQAIKTGGSMAFGWGNDSSKARDVDVAVLTKRLEAADLDLGYYTPSGHKAAFSLPRCIEKLLL
jgi:spermidine synthase